MRLLYSVIFMGLGVFTGCVSTPNAEVNRPKYDDLADSDRDGVINQRDICADSPKGSLVSSQGCGLWSRGSEKEIFTVDFDYDQSFIRDDQREVILHLVKVLKAYPEVHVELIGDTSPEGSAEYNLALAKRRANSIAAELMRLGVERARIRRHTYQELSQLVSLELGKKRERRTKAILHHPGDNQAEQAWSIYTAEENMRR